VLAMDNNKNIPNIILDKDENQSIIYSNGVSMSVTFYDFQLVFQSQLSKPDGIHIKDLQRVMMSPQHTKTLYLVL
jgi:hypothetical protein